MQLTRFTDYSLRLLIFLAHRQGMPTTIRDVSDAHGVSEDHMMKVVQRLGSLGYIKTTRGRNGGISPARAPADISIGKVVRDVESLAPVECFLPKYDGSCLLYPNCALRGALQSAQLQYLKILDTYSVADVMGKDPMTATGLAAPAVIRSLPRPEVRRDGPRAVRRRAKAR